jgi:DNA-binding transcriptional regulator GbsR (MarR family)
MQLFRQARTLINRQIKDDKRHYPFRVASTYQDFFDRFQSKFSEGELKEISQAAETVAQRIEQLHSDRANNKYVRRCKDAMNYIRESIAARLEQRIPNTAHPVRG